MFFVHVKRHSISYIVSIFLVSLFLVVSYFLKPRKILFFFDSFIGSNVKQQIISDIYLDKIGGKNILFNNIKQYFPALKSVSLLYEGSRSVHIFVRSYEPILKVKYKKETNLEDIFTQDGQLIEKSFFKDIYIESLNVIQIEGSKQSIEECFGEFSSCFLKINHNLFEFYEVIWRNKTEIILQSKQFKNFYIIADTENLHDNQRFIYAEKIFKSKNGTKTKNGLKIDIRFKDFVCTPLGG